MIGLNLSAGAQPSGIQGYLAGDCEFETRFLRQSVRLLENSGARGRNVAVLAAVCGWNGT